MKYLLPVSVSVIAILMALDFVSATVWPTLYLEDHRRQYLALKTACVEAQAFADAATFETSAESDPGLRFRLIRASQVGLVVCHDHDVLRTKLLRVGVHHLDLALLDLEALTAEDVPLQVMIAPYER